MQIQPRFCITEPLTNLHHESIKTGKQLEIVSNFLGLQLMFVYYNKYRATAAIHTFANHSAVVTGLLIESVSALITQVARVADITRACSTPAACAFTLQQQQMSSVDHAAAMPPRPQPPPPL